MLIVQMAWLGLVSMIQKKEAEALGPLGKINRDSGKLTMPLNFLPSNTAGY